jgi:hypothetical protein
VNDSAWSNDLTVEVGGHGVVSHAGSAVLRLLADRTGLTAGLSRALSRRGFTPVHDRGRVLADAAVCIADGGRVLSDLAALRDQAELYGPVASDATLWRALEEIGDTERVRIAAARARTRRRVWKLIEARHGRIPPSRVADIDLGKTVVIRLDATIQIAHSDRQGAAGTFKGTYGHHPLTAWCDNTCESLAFRLRPGSAGSNTASDHIASLDEAIAQVPDPYRRDLLVTVDGAGATLDLINHITALNAVHGRRVHYSVGFDLDHRARAAIGQLGETDWQHVWDRDGEPRDLDGDHAAGVVELTGLLRTSVGGTPCRTGRPTCASTAAANDRRRARSCVGWRRPTAGATSCSPPTPAAGSQTSSRPATAATPAWRTASAAGRPPAWAISRPPRWRSTRPGVSPPPSPRTCCAGYDCSAWTPRWPTPNPKPCATGSCTPPPDSSAANANAKSRSPRPGPGPTSSPPRSTPPSP